MIGVTKGNARSLDYIAHIAFLTIKKPTKGSPLSDLLDPTAGST